MEKLVADQIVLLQDWIACAERRLAAPSGELKDSLPSDMTPERLNEMRTRLTKLKAAKKRTAPNATAQLNRGGRDGR